MLVADAVLQGRYKVIHSVGHGGMGAVYMAKDLRLGSVVALKENFFTDEKMIKAFEHEARLLASLRHVALPKVFDHFSIGEGQFLVMEYIYGDDFVEMLEKRRKTIEPLGTPKPFEIQEVIAWAEQLLDALDYIHTQQYPIIHRDIKPQNLKLARRNQIILLDFGLAKGNSSQTSIKSTSGSLLGYTPNYAPIEQIQGAGTDPRTDLYSLGATFYHLLTGLPPIASAIRAEAFLGGEPDPLRPPKVFNSKIPHGLDDLIMAALQQHRNKRPSSAAEMLKMLRSLTRPMTNGVNANRQPSNYRTTVIDEKKAAEIQLEQQEKARQEKEETERRRKLEEEARQLREEADARKQKLEEKLYKAREEAERQRQLEEQARKAREDAEQLKQQEEEARNARKEAESLMRELEEQTRHAIEEMEQGRALEEQARKAIEEIEQRRHEEELRRKAELAEAQRRQRQEEEEEEKYLEEQARRIKQEEQRQRETEEQARKASEEAKRLRQELEAQMRKAKEEVERRKLQEEIAHQAREEAAQLKQQEQARKAREEAERRRLQEELERRVKEEAAMQKALSDWEQMARTESEKKRFLEQQMYQATQEAQRLKQLLEEQTHKAAQEAEKRKALEEQAHRAAQEAEKRKALEEQARRATEEAAQLKQKEQERIVREESEKKKLQAERAQIALEENKRLLQLEKQAVLAAQESEILKHQLAEQARKAEFEAEKRRQLEEEVKKAEKRLLEEQERNAESLQREQSTQILTQTRDLTAWMGLPADNMFIQKEHNPFDLQKLDANTVPPVRERELFGPMMEDEKTPDRSKWMIIGAVFIALFIFGIVRIVPFTSRPKINVSQNQVLDSLLNADSYVQIAAGNFIMGANSNVKDERPAHKVILSKAFEMSKYEVTQEQWEAVMNSTPSKFKGTNLPVDNVSWNEIKNFLDKLSKKDAKYFYRLPTEAEWEYACRAGSTSETFANLDSLAWYKKNLINEPQPVGKKQPNTWGLYDMIGNVFEYCQDYYLENYYDFYKDSNGIDPQGPPSGTLCAFRGGNYGSSEELCRPARRWGASPNARTDGVGFRLVRLPR
jgi:formylglycine-generating enzyme required for sulfatase activity/serine/threonine protein kinase